MADIISLPGGRNETVFNERDFMYLLEEYMGFEARRWLEDRLGEDEASERIGEMEEELKGEKEHCKEVMEELRQYSVELAELITEKELDRKAISAAAGEIGAITWREMNR